MDGGDALDALYEALLAELSEKRKDYVAKAWRAPLLWTMAGAGAGLLKRHLLFGIVAGIVIGLLWSGYYLWQASKDPRNAPVLALLRTRRHDIVWVYARDEHRGDSAVLILGLVDGTRHEVPVVGGPERLAATMASVGDRLPWVTVGFHHEHERRYFADPESLRRDPRKATGRPG